MNLNDDVVYRRLRLGPLHQLHPGRSRSLIRHHNRLHRSPPCVEFLPARYPLQPLSQDGLSERNGSIKILAAPASMRNAEWPCHVSFIGIVSFVICLFVGNSSLCLLRVAFTLSKLVLFVIGSHAQFRDRFRSLSNVNLSGSQNASKNAAAAAEKTE